MTRKRRMCVEMFLAGAQRLSQKYRGLLGYHVCRHRYEERGDGGRGCRRQSGMQGFYLFLDLKGDAAGEEGGLVNVQTSP